MEHMRLAVVYKLAKPEQKSILTINCDVCTVLCEKNVKGLSLLYGTADIAKPVIVCPETLGSNA